MIEGFSDGSVVKNSPAHAGDTGLTPGSGRSPRRKWQPTPIFLPGGSHGQRDWQATVHGVGYDSVIELTLMQPWSHGIYTRDARMV